MGRLFFLGLGFGGDWPLGFADFGGAAADTIAEEVKLGATCESFAFDLNFLNYWGVEWEDLLDTNLVGSDLADDEGRVT